MKKNRQFKITVTDSEPISKKLRFSSVWLAFMILCMSLAACGRTHLSYDTYEIPEQEESQLEPVSSWYLDDSYEGIEPVQQETLATYVSADGLCIIEKKEAYYDVTLDYENGSYKEVGAAYAEAILLAYPEYATVMEPYLYENLRLAFPNLQGDYTPVMDRLNILKASLAEDYQAEMEGFAEVMSKGEQGFAENGRISYEEGLLIHMIPDALRGTSCSAMSVWGEKSATGAPITARILEWSLGSENQMCTAHCVVHMVNGEKSLTSITVLGMLDLLTAVNDDGVFIGEFDVGSGENYTCEGKTCYTYDIRYALENFDNATDAGNYLAGNSYRYTFSHNLILTDKEHSFCVENPVTEAEGVALIRDDTTRLHENLVWDTPDSLCVVNAFAAAGNVDSLTGAEGNLIRWLKYKEWIGAVDQVSVTDVKNMLTCEQVDSTVVNVHSESVFHMVILDHATGTIQVAFTGEDGVVDKPEFIDVGTYEMQ